MCLIFQGTEHVEVKIYLIGVFATFIAILSIIFNTFFTIVFLTNESIKKSSVFYFGILAVIDTIMAVNYIAVMSLPVYMDYYHYLPIYHLFLSYFRIVLTESNCAMFSSVLLIVLATTERLLRTFNGVGILKARRLIVRDVFLVRPHAGPTEAHIQYEIIPGPLTMYYDYRFWWMFITRNALDRILPFFVLVAMNYLIIKVCYSSQDRVFIKNDELRFVIDKTCILHSLVYFYFIRTALSNSTTMMLRYLETSNLSPGSNPRLLFPIAHVLPIAELNFLL
uniref:G protein-coupled receptor n=1 Tax=Angiostrongylus cantonensis TaxID=6313 RepID=A0A158P6Q3_ANGCA